MNRRPLLAPALAGALVCAIAAPAAARDISGALSYRERIALSPEAGSGIEVRGPAGPVARQFTATAGAQVPLPFALAVPEGGDLTLQGALFEAGLPVWISDPVPLPEGAADLGPLPLRRAVVFPDRRFLRCGDRDMVLDLRDAAALLRWPEGEALMAAGSGPAGRSFSDGAARETAVTLAANTARVTLQGAAPTECTPILGPPLLPFTARGNEPGWVISVGTEGFALSAEDGTRLDGALPRPDVSGDGLRFGLSGGQALTLTPSPCEDSMTGMPYPMTARIEGPGGAMEGCAGNPLDRLTGVWRVREIDGTDVAGMDITVEVAAATEEGAAVAGSAGCNRYATRLQSSGETIAFAAAAATKMACAPDRMQAESAFLGALAVVDGFGFADGGTLELSGEGRPLIRAQR